MNKEKLYQRIILQITDLLTETDNAIARMATINAVLHHKMKNLFWTGFYVIQHGELIVGPYQGPLACQKLKKNTGVCWTAINERKTIIVEDVDEFPGHIACDSRSKSEIAVPVFNTENKTVAVLDIDSQQIANFDRIDQLNLEKIVKLI